MYITREEFAQLAPPPGALRSPAPPEPDQDAVIGAACALADGYLRGRYDLPLRSCGADLKMAVAAVALWYLLGKRGVVSAAAVEPYRIRFQDAVRWLEAVRDGKVVLDIMDNDPSDDAPYGQAARARVTTGTPRGW